MKYSGGVEYVLSHAKFIKSFYHDSEMRVEYYFCGIALFASTIPATQPQLAKEIEDAAKILKDVCWKDPGTLMTEVRSDCEKYKDKLSAAGKCLENAEKLAKETEYEEVRVEHLLCAVFAHPSEILANYIKKRPGDKKVQAPKQEDKAQKQAEFADVMKKVNQEVQKNQENTGKLASLAQKIEDMASFLAEHVKGQDHAVRAVADGYFNSEVLLDAEENRKRPRATFTFAGPPGVGKTFLAEKIAEYLDLPFLCVDMSSCSDHQLGPQIFQGIQASFNSAKPGVVTDFVSVNPKCVLLFDEVEKAHINVLHLFYQMLDRGVLKDLHKDKDISFKDTIIIITTNAGHNLYEGKEEENISLLPSRMVVKALKSDINPKTEEPFFPEALISRMARGTVLVFNHLRSHNLQEIVMAELRRNAGLFKKEYGMDITFDDKIPSLIMYKEGGIADARSLTAQAGEFFKKQILRCVELFNLQEIRQLTEKFNQIHFYAEDWAELEKLDSVFKKEEKTEIMLFGNDALGHSLNNYLPEFVWNVTSDEDAAFDIFAKKDVEAVFLDLVTKDAMNQQNLEDSFQVFEKVNVAARTFQKAWSFVEKMVERFPEIPVYLLDRSLIQIDEQLKLKLVQKGIRDVVDVKDNRVGTYKKQIELCLNHSQLQKIAMFLQSKHKMIKFEVSPYWHKEEREMDIRCRNYVLGDLIDADDQDYLVSDAERPTVKFDEVIGAGEAKEELKFFIEYLQNPKQFIAKGLKPPKGLLFYGPPGTGKTMLAKAMAGETDITFISETASNFVTGGVGSGPEAIRNMFQRARRYAPAILFIDEIDAIGRTRVGSSTAHSEETTLNTLLTEMDGFKVDLKRPVFIIAATNFKVDEGIGGQGYIDPALVRRFDRKILIDLPNRKERQQLLAMLCKKVQNCQVSDKMIDNVAGRAIGLSNAILSNVVSQAVRMAERKNQPLTDEMFEEAFETTVHGEVKNWGHEALERVAWHECGHAYMYWKQGNTPSYLTIVARGKHGGYMQRDAKDAENPLWTREELLENIRVSLAGRAGEVLRYGKEGGASTGISGDLHSATDNVKRLICNYGMDEEIGMIYIDSEMAKNPEIAMMIHRKTVEILNQQMEETIRELSADRKKMERLVRALLDKNSMTGEEIDAVLSDDYDDDIGDF